MGKISKFNNNMLKKNDEIKLDYFYWLYKEIYQFKILGICIKNYKKLFYNMSSFVLFISIKNRCLQSKCVCKLA